MTLREAIKPYRDPDGLVTPQTSPGRGASGNGLLYTSLYFISLEMTDGLVYADMVDFAATVRSCYQERGLLNRSPVKLRDQNGHDDYIGVAAAGRLVAPAVAREVAAYGMKRRGPLLRWVYNNVDPGKFTLQSWLGRHAGFGPHLKIGAGLPVDCVDRAAWNLSVSGGSRADDSTGWMLQWCKVEAARGLGGPIGSASAQWRGRLAAAHPNGMRDVLAQHLGAAHPLAQLAPRGF